MESGSGRTGNRDVDVSDEGKRLAFTPGRPRAKAGRRPSRKQLKLRRTFHCCRTTWVKNQRDSEEWTW